MAEARHIELLNYTRKNSADKLKDIKNNCPPGVKLVRYSQGDFDKEHKNPFVGTTNLRGKSPRGSLRIDPSAVKRDLDRLAQEEGSSSDQKKDMAETPGTFKTEKQTEDVTQDEKRFRDTDSGRKMKASSTKFSRENEKTEVKDEGLDPNAIDGKLPLLGGKDRNGASVKDKDWFLDMMKKSNAKFAKFKHEHQSESEEKEELFNRFWDERARRFQEMMENTNWGMNQNGMSGDETPNVPPPSYDECTSDAGSTASQSKTRTKSEKRQSTTEALKEGGTVTSKKSETSNVNRKEDSTEFFNKFPDGTSRCSSGIGSYQRTSSNDSFGESMKSESTTKGSRFDRDEFFKDLPRSVSSDYSRRRRDPFDSDIESNKSRFDQRKKDVFGERFDSDMESNKGRFDQRKKDVFGDRFDSDMESNKGNFDRRKKNVFGDRSNFADSKCDRSFDTGVQFDERRKDFFKDFPRSASSDLNRDFCAFPKSAESRRESDFGPSVSRSGGGDTPSMASSTSGQPKVTRKVNTYNYSSSKTSFECSVGDKSYSYNQEWEKESKENKVEEEVSEDDDDDEVPMSEFGDDVESLIIPSDVTSLQSEISTVAPETPVTTAPDTKTAAEKARYHLYRVALEVLTTERAYVSKLHLVDQVFRMKAEEENQAHNMFPKNIILKIFSNMRSIYQLHHDFVLPQLEQRMQEWDKVQRIGDIMLRFAPFLKMYTEYVKNYDNSQNTINTWLAKSTRFRAVVDSIQKHEDCGGLSVLHHMLQPVQRVPRYELLLREYLKRLPLDSPDRPDAEKALNLVSAAANHINQAMRKIDKFKKLLEIRDQLGGTVDLVSPTREFVKEGKIVKISARSGDHQDRYLFLFNDMVLLCSELMISKRGSKFKVRARLEVDGLQVVEGDNLETPNTFYLKSRVKTIELYTTTPQLKVEWMDAFHNTIREYRSRPNSLRIDDELIQLEDDELGRRAPVFPKLDSVASCQCCKSSFGLLRAKKQCRACGAIMCSKCVSHKLQLPYDNYQLNRVCSKCHQIIKKVDEEKARVLQEEKARSERADLPEKQGISLQVKANDPNAVISDYMNLRMRARGKQWQRRWFSLHNDFTLFSFKTHQDDHALTSLPLHGYSVVLPDKNDSVDKENVFKLFHKKKVYYFQAETVDRMNKWIEAIQNLINAPDTESTQF